MLSVISKKIRQILSIPVQTGTLLYWLWALMPVFLYLLLAVRYSLNVPFNDEWEIVPLYKSLREGTLSLLTLWQPHNEHRAILFYLIYLELARLSGFNALAPLYVGIFIKVITLFMVYDTLRLTLKDHRGVIPMAMFFASVFVFSAQEGEVIIWGFASLWFNLAAFFTVMLFWALVRYRDTWKGILLALAAALGGSLITAGSLFLWGLGLVSLLILSLTSGRKIVNRRIVTWLLVTGAFLLLFFKDYHGAGSDLDLAWLLGNIGTALSYFLAYLASLSVYYNDPWVSLPIALGCWALILLGANLAFLLTNKDRLLAALRDRFPWVLLPFYVIATALVTTVGRAHFGVWQASSSRYITTSYPLWLSLFVLTAVLVEELLAKSTALSRIAKVAIQWAAPALLIILPIYAAFAGAFTQLLPFWHDRFAIGLNAVYHYQSGPSQLLMYINYRDPSELVSYIKYLDENDLGPFAPGYRPASDTLSETFPAAGKDDFTLSFQDPSVWHYSDLNPLSAPDGQLMIVGPSPTMELSSPIDLCLADYDYLNFQAALPPGGATVESVQVFFRANHAAAYDPGRYIRIPLILDHALHDYSFALRLLKYPADTRINGIRFAVQPVSPLAYYPIQPNGRIVLLGFRLIRGPQASPGGCADAGASQP